jgi:hypothetical protein
VQTATLARLREAQNRRSSPPGPVDSWLGETLAHAEDIRRPLGIAHAYPVGALSRVTSFYRGSNLLIGRKDRIAGLTLRATDTDWTPGRAHRSRARCRPWCSRGPGARPPSTT